MVKIEEELKQPLLGSDKVELKNSLQEPNNRKRMAPRVTIKTIKQGVEEELKDDGK